MCVCGGLFQNSTLLHNCQLFLYCFVYMLTQHWPCYCTVHGGTVVHFCDIVLSLWVEAKRICTCILLLYLYICIAVGDPFIKGEMIGIPLTGSGRKGFVQSQAKCPSSCVVVFLCSIWIWGEGDCWFEARVIVVLMRGWLLFWGEGDCCFEARVIVVLRRGWLLFSFCWYWFYLLTITVKTFCTQYDNHLI